MTHTSLTWNLRWFFFYESHDSLILIKYSCSSMGPNYYHLRIGSNRATVYTGAFLWSAPLCRSLSRHKWNVFWYIATMYVICDSRAGTGLIRKILDSTERHWSCYWQRSSSLEVAKRPFWTRYCKIELLSQIPFHVGHKCRMCLKGRHTCIWFFTKMNLKLMLNRLQLSSGWRFVSEVVFSWWYLESILIFFVLY